MSVLRVTVKHVLISVLMVHRTILLVDRGSDDIILRTFNTTRPMIFCVKKMCETFCKKVPQNKS